MAWTIKIRCPVCNGTGSVEPSFGMGGTETTGTSSVGAKKCPACNGTGMQEVSTWGTNLTPVEIPSPVPPYIPPRPWYSPPFWCETKTNEVNPCTDCSFFKKLELMRQQGRTYVGDAPCERCSKIPRRIVF